MNDIEMPASMAASVLGDRVQAYLRALRTGGRELSDGDIATTWSKSNPRFVLYREQFVAFNERLGDFWVTSYESPRERFVTAILENAAGRRWRCNVAIDRAPPHLIIGSALFPAPPDVRVRKARESDAAALRELERLTPLTIGDVRITYDRGPDYFANERLMGDVSLVVVERDERIIGLSGTAFPRVRINGIVRKGQYAHRLRLLPEAQGQGVSGPLSAWMMQEGVSVRRRVTSATALSLSAMTRSCGRWSQSGFGRSGHHD